MQHLAGQAGGPLKAMSVRPQSGGLSIRYVRFVVAAADETSQVRMGVFQAAVRLRNDGDLTAAEQDLLAETTDWFNRHLERPSRFSRKQNAYHKDQRAIAWFRDTATAHISRMRSLVAILEQHGLAVQMLSTSRTGYVVYEDEFQVVAEPFSDTQT